MEIKIVLVMHEINKAFFEKQVEEGKLVGKDGSRNRNARHGVSCASVNHSATAANEQGLSSEQNLKSTRQSASKD
jgi:hypothetical protein